MELTEFGLRVGAAALAGLLIGVEREVQNKNAGLKTNALVSLGAALFVLASLYFRHEANVDITRVLSQVVTGIGFIGAGVILHKGTTVTGITTAATVWCSAGAGCFAAFGLFKELLILTLLIVFINIFFRKLDTLINRRFNKKKKKKTED